MAGFDLTRARAVLAEYEDEIERLQHVEDFLSDQLDGIQRERYRAEDKVRAYKVAIETYVDGLAEDEGEFFGAAGMA